MSGDEDAAFRRFLVARKWDVDKAEAQLRGTLAWRKEQFRVHSFLVRPVPCRSLAWHPWAAPHPTCRAGQPPACAPGARALPAARQPAPGVLQGGVASHADQRRRLGPCQSCWGADRRRLGAVPLPSHAGCSPASSASR